MLDSDLGCIERVFRQLAQFLLQALNCCRVRASILLLLLVLAFMRSAREFKFPLFCIYPSLEAEFFSALRVFDGDVFFPGPVDFQTGPL